jgi:hypothetical protein
MKLIGFSRALALVLALVLAPSAAFAADTYFLTDKNGQVRFPLSPPNRAAGTPGSIDNMTIGGSTPAKGSFSQVVPVGGQPTIASGSCGTGTNGAVVAGSVNQSGQITIGASAATACPVVFNGTLSPAPKSCVISPTNAAAAAAGTAGGFVGIPSTTGFTISGAALANTNWAYQCW